MSGRLVGILALCLPMRSQPLKKNDATCTSPIMHLICPPKFCISIIFNFFGTAIISRRNEKHHERLCKIGGGEGGWANKVMIMGDVQVTNPAILTEQTWSIKDLFYYQIIVVFIHNSLSYCYLVFYE